MDENFISRAFATMGETVMSVKIIRNRLTGYRLAASPYSSPTGSPVRCTSVCPPEAGQRRRQDRCLLPSRRGW